MNRWTKTPSGAYEAILNGRRFHLLCNRRTRTRSHRNRFGFGSHRVSTSSTWYTIYEETASGWANVTPQTSIPGSLAEAKRVAADLAEAAPQLVRVNLPESAFHGHTGSLSRILSSGQALVSIDGAEGEYVFPVAHLEPVRV